MSKLSEKINSTESEQRNPTVLDKMVHGATCAGFVSSVYLGIATVADTQFFQNLKQQNSLMANGGSIAAVALGGAVGGLIAVGTYKIAEHILPDDILRNRPRIKGFSRDLGASAALPLLAYDALYGNNNQHKYARALAMTAAGALCATILPTDPEPVQEKLSFQEKLAQQRQDIAIGSHYERT
ncbi:MAG: hypothetical protein EAZ74_06025 [Alphaproteobacteria bacterium]|nr:MAG: hypothetical protein EAY76_05745 [Alphaproteobacteria bacterium]TAF13310.1 MAG: hypothetical protein EAZ74_06025 [Alphaproteobacteria bacterium]